MEVRAARFGGSWTDEKLERVRKYLVAYTRIMRRRRYRFAYIDAFAGSGYRAVEDSATPEFPLFPELFEEDTQAFLEGSARIALQVEPRFTEYIFIERDRARCAELAKLREEFPDRAADIHIALEDANVYLRQLCVQRDWQTNRILVFLDPYGMDVEWETTAALARTKAADVWMLFPLGVAVNRLLTRDGEIPEHWRQRLDRIFGTADWFDAFYTKETLTGLFGPVSQTRKVANFAQIGAFFVDRLRSVFEGVAENPLFLLNSTNNPLYLLCFATANPCAVDVSLRIAQDILGR
jgi:three-Cys-motif partner protein